MSDSTFDDASALLPKVVDTDAALNMFMRSNSKQPEYLTPAPVFLTEQSEAEGTVGTSPEPNPLLHSSMAQVLDNDNPFRRTR